MTQGRITLFNSKDQEKDNPPKFNGIIEMNGEKFSVSLWENQKASVTGGVYYSGQIKEYINE